MALCALAIALLLDFGVKTATAANQFTLLRIVRVAAVFIVAIQVAVLGATAWQMRTQQRVIENTVRKDIGQWLNRQASPKDTVLLEPLGYVGYYSRLKTFDMPGLSSAEVVAAVRAGARRYVELIERLHPTWLVLRPTEIADSSKPENAVYHDYELVRVWNVRSQLDAVKFLPGRGWLEHDAEFRVFRRKTPAGPVSVTTQP
jgi:hypothetical protein